MAKRDAKLGAALAAGGVVAVAAGVLAWRTFHRREELDLAGRVVLITDGATGLGLRLALEFARERCRLVVCGSDAAGLRQAGRQLVMQGTQVLALPCDVSDRDEVARVVKEAVAHFGRIDVIVNNPSSGTGSPVLPAVDESATAREWLGVLHTVFAVLPQMRARGSGRVVNLIPSAGARRPARVFFRHPHSMMDSLSEGLHAELAPWEIIVTTVLLERTAMQAGVLPNSPAAADVARRIVHAVKRGETRVRIGGNGPRLLTSTGTSAGSVIGLLGRGRGS